jgi:hypothetical protein
MPRTSTRLCLTIVVGAGLGVLWGLVAGSSALGPDAVWQLRRITYDGVGHRLVPHAASAAGRLAGDLACVAANKSVIDWSLRE